MNLLLSLRSEILKTKRTASFYLALIAGGLGPVMSMLDLLLDGVPAEGPNLVLNKMFTAKYQMTGSLVLPWFIILICTLLAQIEHKNNAWKQVLTSPQTKANVWLAKFLNIHVLIMVFLLTNQLSVFAVAIILHFTEPSLNLLHQPLNGYAVFLTLANNYVTLLALCTIQFWLGIRFKNFVAPVAIGLSLWFIGLLMVLQFESKAGLYFPYSFHVYSGFPKHSAKLPTVEWASLGYTVLFLILGFADFRRKRMNG